MAQKFKDRVLQGSGFSNRKFESDYAMKLMSKMGWADGQGLGKNKDGQTDCVQIQRRGEFQAIGQKANQGSQWEDQWWEASYSTSLRNLVPISSNNLAQRGESDDEDNLSDYKKHRINGKSKRQGVQSVQVLPEDSSDEDTFISIQKKSIKKVKTCRRM